MKLTITFMLAILLISCGETKNEKMTSLINKQKELELKIDSVEKLGGPFMDTFSLLEPETSDIIEGRKLNLEFATNKEMQVDSLRNHWKSVNFSIDSLEKMK